MKATLDARALMGITGTVAFWISSKLDVGLGGAQPWTTYELPTALLRLLATFEPFVDQPPTVLEWLKIRDFHATMCRSPVLGSVAIVLHEPGGIHRVHDRLQLLHCEEKETILPFHALPQQYERTNEIRIYKLAEPCNALDFLCLIEFDVDEVFGIESPIAAVDSLHLDRHGAAAFIGRENIKHGHVARKRRRDAVASTTHLSTQ